MTLLGIVLVGLGVGFACLAVFSGERGWVIRGFLACAAMIFCILYGLLLLTGAGR